MLGKQIQQARLDAGLTQEKVAADARISREYMSMLEHDKYQPTVEVFLRVCRAIGVEGWRIIKDVEDKKT